MRDGERPHVRRDGRHGRERHQRLRRPVVTVAPLVVLCPCCGQHARHPQPQQRLPGPPARPDRPPARRGTGWPGLKMVLICRWPKLSYSTSWMVCIDTPSRCAASRSTVTLVTRPSSCWSVATLRRLGHRFAAGEQARRPGGELGGVGVDQRVLVLRAADPGADLDVLHRLGEHREARHGVGHRPVAAAPAPPPRRHAAAAASARWSPPGVGRRVDRDPAPTKLDTTLATAGSACRAIGGEAGLQLGHRGDGDAPGSPPSRR